jgi:tRNA pseudouridine13 synthase
LENWGNWKKCFNLLPRSSERSIITYLVDHPTNFRQAFELLDPNIILLYLNSYQSYLWNKGLGSLLLNYLTKKEVIRVPYLLGDFIFYHYVIDNRLALLKELDIPLVTHKTQIPGQNEEIQKIFYQILEEEGIELKDFKIRGMKKTYFRKGNRPALIFPQNLSAGGIKRDELNNGKMKLLMEFELPRGSYATILVKRISYDF